MALFVDAGALGVEGGLVRGLGGAGLAAGGAIIFLAALALAASPCATIAIAIAIAIAIIRPFPTTPVAALFIVLAFAIFA